MRSVVGELQEHLIFVEVIKRVSSLRRLLKEILSNRISREDGVIHLIHECGAILQNKILRKVGDLGPFTLPCLIGDLSFKRCLCDLGASISLIPLSISRKLGLNCFKPSHITLVLADRSVIFPKRLLEKILVQIGKCWIQTDFIILKLDEEPENPIILGRPFLATAGAIVNVKEEKINLHLDDLFMKFNVNNIIKIPSISGQSFWLQAVEEVVSDMYNGLNCEDCL